MPRPVAARWLQHTSAGQAWSLFNRSRPVTVSAWSCAKRQVGTGRVAWDAGGALEFFFPAGGCDEDTSEQMGRQAGDTAMCAAYETMQMGALSRGYYFPLVLMLAMLPRPAHCLHPHLTV